MWLFGMLHSSNNASTCVQHRVPGQVDGTWHCDVSCEIVPVAPRACSVAVAGPAGCPTGCQQPASGRLEVGPG